MNSRCESTARLERTVTPIDCVALMPLVQHAPYYVHQIHFRKGEHIEFMEAEHRDPHAMVRLGGLKLWTDGLIEKGTANVLPRVDPIPKE